MPGYVVFVDGVGTELHTDSLGLGKHLVVEARARVDTQFASAVHTTAATTAIAIPKIGGALVLTDMVISGEKITGGIITVRFTDGSNTVNLLNILVNDGIVNMAVPLQGLCLGWRNARVELVTSQSNQDATLTVWYFHVAGSSNKVKSFEDWNADR